MANFPDTPVTLVTKQAAQLVVDDQTEAILDAKWKLTSRKAALDHVLTKTALSKQSREVYRAYVLEDRPVEEVMARFGIPRNSVYQIKVRIDKMVAAVEREISDGGCHMPDSTTSATQQNRPVKMSATKDFAGRVDRRIEMRRDIFAGVCAMVVAAIAWVLWMVCMMAIIASVTSGLKD